MPRSFLRRFSLVFTQRIASCPKRAENFLQPACGLSLTSSSASPARSWEPIGSAASSEIERDQQIVSRPVQRLSVANQLCDGQHHQGYLPPRIPEWPRLGPAIAEHTVFRRKLQDVRRLVLGRGYAAYKKLDGSAIARQGGQCSVEPFELF